VTAATHALSSPSDFMSEFFLFSFPQPYQNQNEGIGWSAT